MKATEVIPESRMFGWQKVADIYSKNVYVYASRTGWDAYTTPQSNRELVIMVPSLTTDEKLTPSGDHGFGDNTPREYATPEGAGKRL